ncbi:MAG: hypothetical protein ABIP30_07065 [Ferruginibacter sp.]
MKLKQFLPLIIILAGIYFTSCQKGISEENSIIPPSTTKADSGYLSKIYFIDISGGSNDTAGDFRYVYDSQKRVINIIDSSYDTFDYSIETYTYSYNGTDTLPSSVTVVTKFQNNQPDLWLERYFYYNSIGQRIKDSTFSNYQDNIIENYKYTSGNIYMEGRGKALGGLPIIFDTATLDPNKNIISNVKWYNNYKTVSTVTYDNHPSPFAKLSNYKALEVFPFGETFFYEMPQKNNRLAITESVTFNGNPQSDFDEDLTGKYSYRADGYPTQIIAPDVKYIFVYKTL